MSEHDRQLAGGYERLYAFVKGAIDSGRPLRDDWSDALADMLIDLDAVVQRAGHPDDVLHARSAMSSLAGLWLSVEEAEAVYLGESDV